MANVNLPMPVVVAGGALALLGGYLIGVVAGPDTPDRATGVVESYDSTNAVLCLGGDAVSDQDGVNDEGVLCGTWQRPQNADTPVEGDRFRFVTMKTATSPDAESGGTVLIYGDVVD
ncbi:exported hypothetical protein [metagenome]|uniref:Uncharacterized protein n=1 Tax=metagenome TaxID=256318 RepID=A0A2P2C5E4_9ZZZZ